MKISPKTLYFLLILSSVLFGCSKNEIPSISRIQSITLEEKPDSIFKISNQQSCVYTTLYFAINDGFQPGTFNSSFSTVKNVFRNMRVDSVEAVKTNLLFDDIPTKGNHLYSTLDYSYLEKDNYYTLSLIREYSYQAIKGKNIALPGKEMMKYFVFKLSDLEREGDKFVIERKDYRLLLKVF
jgi:hypothetical protein